MGGRAQVSETDEGPTALTVRIAGSADAEAVGQLLHDFNSEFDEPTPGPDRLAERIRRMLAAGDTAVLLGGTGPDGVAVLRFRAAIWSDALECYLAELYVVPQRRGRLLSRLLSRLKCVAVRGLHHKFLGKSEWRTKVFKEIYRGKRKPMMVAEPAGRALVGILGGGLPARP